MGEEPQQCYFQDGGAVKPGVTKKWVSAWAKQRKLSPRRRNWAAKVGYAKMKAKPGAIWRNIIKIRCHFPDAHIQIDA